MSASIHNPWGVALSAISPTVAVGVAPRVVERLKRKYGDGYEKQKTDKMRQLELVAALPVWLKAQQKISQRKEKGNIQNMGYKEKRRLFEPAIGFNNVLREMIASEQYETAHDLVRLIERVMRCAVSDEELRDFGIDQAVITLAGMRHEVAAERVLRSIPEVDGVNQSSVGQDLDGVDLVVQYKGEQLFIDVKSKQYDTRKYKGDRHDRRHLAIWSGFDKSDFGGMLVPPKDEIIAKQEYYRHILDKAIA